MQGECPGRGVNKPGVKPEIEQFLWFSTSFMIKLNFDIVVQLKIWLDVETTNTTQINIVYLALSSWIIAPRFIQPHISLNRKEWVSLKLGPQGKWSKFPSHTYNYQSK